VEEEEEEAAEEEGLGFRNTLETQGSLLDRSFRRIGSEGVTVPDI